MKSKTARRSAHSARGDGGALGRVSIMLRAVAAGLAVTAALLLAFSLLVSQRDIPFGLINPMSAGALIAGSMLSGFLAARGVREKGLLVGVECGCIIFVVLLFASFLSRFDVGAQALIKLAIAATSGAIGGVLGVNARTRRK